MVTGFYNRQEVLPDIEIKRLNVTANGTYSESGKAYRPVVVNVPEPEGTKSITANGTYDVKPFESAEVNVPAPEPVLESLSVTENGTYTPETGVDGFDEVTVNVPIPTPTGTKNITDTLLTDVSEYANAQVVDANLIAENIKKDVSVLGVTGTFEGGGSVPEKGFVVNEWNSSGYPIDVTFYGNKIQNYEFCNYGAFAGLWTRMVRITLPTTLETVAVGAFRNCNSLPSISFKSTPQSIANDAFSGCTSLTDIYVPWPEGEVANAPWGATDATIHYNYVPS